MTKNTDISVAELKQKIDAGDSFRFIDVRELYEYQQFNLKAELIPLGQLTEHIPDILSNKDEEIIIHCLSGQRSNTAKIILNRAGCTNVRNVLGGVLDWINKFGPSVS